MAHVTTRVFRAKSLAGIMKDIEEEAASANRKLQYLLISPL